jgi:hypothetical protein
MGLLVLGMVFVAALGGILLLERHWPQAWFTGALREWQTGIGALLGLLSVGAAIEYQSILSRTERDTERRLEASSVGAALYSEVYNVQYWLEDVDGALEVSSNYVGVADFCKNAVPLFNKTSRDAVGVFEALAEKMGDLPGRSTYLFTMMWARWTDAKRLLSAATEVECGRNPRLWLDAIRMRTESVRTSMRELSDEMTNSGLYIVLPKHR